MNFSDLVDIYFRHPDFKGLSDKSKTMYEIYLGRLKALAGDLPLTDRGMLDRVARSRSPHKGRVDNLTTIWWDLIEGYKNPDGKPTTNATKNTLHTYLKVAYRFAILRGYCNEIENPTRFGGWEHIRPKFIPFQLPEIKAILASVEDPSYPEDIKAYMMFVVTMFYYGLRPMDMYKHKTTWFATQGTSKYLQVFGGKGKDKKSNDGKGVLSHMIKLDANDLKLLEFWQNQPVWPGCEKFTFRTSRGKAFANSGWMAEKIRMGCTLAGIPPRELYDARRGLVSTLFKGGMEFSRIKARVGHVKESTTKRYAILDKAETADTYTSPFGKASNA